MVERLQMTLGASAIGVTLLSVAAVLPGASPWPHPLPPERPGLDGHAECALEVRPADQAGFADEFS